MSLDTVTPVGEERGSRRRFQEAPASLVLIGPGVPFQKIGNQIGDAPRSFLPRCFTDGPFDERAVGPVVWVRKHGQQEQFAALDRDLVLERDGATFCNL